MSTKGRSLELFFVDGRPDGMLTAEVFNWTGHVLRVPRGQIAELSGWPESDRTGVYVLVGERDEEPLAYIGEAENLRKRLASHIREKDWWNEAVLISMAEDQLHRGHIKYLEARLVQIARRVGSISLENGNSPTPSSLSRAAEMNMEAFIETLEMVLPAIRMDMFLRKDRPRKTAERSAASDSNSNALSGTFILETPRHGVFGKARLVDGEWIVAEGSIARDRWSGSEASKTHYYKLHKELVESGILTPVNGQLVFSTDYAFSSPAAAAAILNGRSSNGRVEWKEEISGISYGDWEVSKVEASE